LGKTPPSALGRSSEGRSSTPAWRESETVIRYVEICRVGDRHLDRRFCSIKKELNIWALKSPAAICASVTLYWPQTVASVD
jgi:hypothetical protein